MNALVLPVLWVSYWQMVGLKFAVDAARIYLTEADNQLRYYRGR